MENKIIKLLKDNNIRGIDLLAKTYSKNIYFIAKNILKDDFDKINTEDVISDIYIDIYNNINSFNKEKLSFNQFIICRSKFILAEYKNRIDSKESINKDSNVREFTIQDIEIEELINSQDTKEILNIIKSFKEPDRTYFYLRYFRDYDESAISEIYKESINEVQNRLYRCRFKIKTILERGAKIYGK